MMKPTSKKHALSLSLKKYEKLLEKAQNGIQIAAREIDGVTCACCAYSDEHPLFEEQGDRLLSCPVAIECSNCLISEFTGRTGCGGTPWLILSDYMQRVAEADLPQTKQTILGHLQREIDFLLRVRAKNQ